VFVICEEDDTDDVTVADADGAAGCADAAITDSEMLRV